LAQTVFIVEVKGTVKMESINRIHADSAEAKSIDLVAHNLAVLKSLFPELVTERNGEVSLNLDVLKQLVGDKTVTDADEKFGLNWHGKKIARQMALTPSAGTLRPCPEESVEWDTTRNLMIEGDNLEVLKLLQKSYAGKVKLIYIDPPYNTGKDFVYPDNFQDNIRNYLELTGQVGEGGQKLTSNTESSGRFHTDWLNMMYPRLKLARNLLRDDGAIFITIDGNEVANLIALLNEVFGEENAIVSAVWEKRVSPANDAKWFSSDHDFIVVYAKQKESWRPNKLNRTEDQLSNYKNPDNDPRGPWNSATYTCNKSREERPNLYYPIRNPHTGEDVWPKETAVWKYGPDVTAQQQADGRLYWGAEGKAAFPRAKLFLSEMGNVVPRSVWSYEDVGHTQEATAELKALFSGKQVFDSPKPVRLLQRILELGSSNSNDLVLDFFAGSGTTAHACFLNAASTAAVRFILVQLPEQTVDQTFGNIANITKERLRRAGARIREENPLFASDLGFRVFKLASSNIRAWEPNRDKLAETLEASIEHLKTDRTEQDILFELLLKLGLDLTVPIEQKVIAGKTVHSIGVGTLIVCLAPAITAEEVESLALGIVEWHKAQAPAGESTLVFRDSAFGDDVAKTNLAAILQQNGLQTVRSI
jgi:adenine-specific DNA-methyltransferase